MILQKGSGCESICPWKRNEHNLRQAQTSHGKPSGRFWSLSQDEGLWDQPEQLPGPHLSPCIPHTDGPGSLFWASEERDSTRALSTLAPESNCWLGRWPQGLPLHKVNYAHCFSTRRGASPLSWSLLSRSLEFSHGKLRIFFLTLSHSGNANHSLLLADWARYWQQRNLDETEDEWFQPVTSLALEILKRHPARTTAREDNQTFIEFPHPNGMFISPSSCLDWNLRDYLFHLHMVPKNRKDAASEKRTWI